MDKKTFYITSTILSIIAVAVLVYAYSGTNPAVHGHAVGELGGLSQNFTGDWAFGGTLTAQEPTEDHHVATKAWVEANAGGVKWAGYTTSAYNGNMGGMIGMNTKCHTDHPGSHACTYEELIRLGNSYPNTDAGWVVDGSYSSTGYQYTIDGYYASSSNGPYNAMCAGWGSDSSGYMGPALQQGGFVNLNTCNGQNKIPCCS